MKKIIIILIAMFAVYGCSNSVNLNKNVATGSLSQQYSRAIIYLNSGRYQIAAEEFWTIAQEYPYSIWGRRSMLLSSYSYLLDANYDQSISTIKQYITLYPSYPENAYASYLLARSYYNQVGLADREQKNTKLALDAFNNLINRYPTSSYAKDAKEKAAVLYQELANNNLIIGKYYEKKKNYIAAIGRFQVILKDFPKSKFVPEASFRIVESYIALNQPALAKIQYLSMMKNFRQSTWTARADLIIKRNVR